MSSSSTSSILPPCCPTFSLLALSDTPERHPSTGSASSSDIPNRLRAAACFAHRSACIAHSNAVSPPPPPPTPRTSMETELATLAPRTSWEARRAQIEWLDAVMRAPAAAPESATPEPLSRETSSSTTGMSSRGPRYGRLRVTNLGPGDEMYEEPKQDCGEEKGKEGAVEESESESEGEQTRRVLLEATRAAQRRLRQHYRRQGWGALGETQRWVVDEVRWYHHLEGRTDAVARYEERVWREYEEKRGLRGARKYRTGLGLDWGM